ncbi:response regulator transcription factor [Pontivivens ytuae]|uniref:Response regulator transcription factor n=1 Tax=Pontivivens ytuae TaxID=2789856 RepID=A0A7S9LUH6_9RHOB|nr:response regulator transcription factor [Pontivivens ytuae]QPH55497.1 response regulator transcription factor [Pontivivens ytuae]
MNVLLIEDEMRVANFIRRGLSAEGWTVQHAPDGETGVEMLAQGKVDVIVLDLMLPGISGQDVCRKLRMRRDPTPILMLSALDSAEERTSGLRIGADDYLPKPFDFDELIARIEALHRRATAFDGRVDTEVVDCGRITFDRRSHIMKVDEAPLELSAKEREVLLFFMSNPGRVLSRERILNAVWSINEDPMTNVVDVYVGRLRKKLGEQGRRIVTLRNVGYRFE